MSQIRVTCGRCGDYLGRASEQSEANRIYREHIVECEVIK